MKFKITLLFISFLLFIGNIQAQDVAVTLNVDTAGTLSSLIDPDKKYQITDLTLTGNLNGLDIRYIREMAGRDVKGDTTAGILKKLDMSGVMIVSGGNYYIIFYSKKNTISTYMFQDCKLTSVALPNSVTSIGGAAFNGCTGLTSVTIPNSVTSIGGGAFNGCTGLTSVTIPDSVTYIVNNAFLGCTRIKDIIVEENNKYFCSIDGVLFDKSVEVILVFPNAKSDNYTIPKSVNSININAFRGCAGLTSVTIPNSVTSIGYWAFCDCTGLIEIHCKSVNPLAINSRIFENVDTSTCKLYVPKGSYSSYRLANYWQYFTNIIEEESSAITPSSVDAISVSSENGEINIKTKNTILVSIYSITGQKIDEKTINDNTQIPLNKGVYILKFGGQTTKVMVK